MKNILAVLLLGFLVFSADAFAWEVETPSKVYEGIAFKIILKGERANAYEWGAIFLGRAYKFFIEGEDAVAILAVPLDTQAGKRSISIEKHMTETSYLSILYWIDVESRTFLSQVVSFPVLSPAELKRHKAEQKRINEITSEYETNAPRLHGFDWPKQDGCIVTSSFGNKRLNSSKKVIGRHWGVDCKAAVGENVYAVGWGVVVFAQKTLLGGNTVIVDHGYGAFSIYMHLSEINVRAGSTINQGHVIAKSGATGRASGPHLHLGIKVNSIDIDPIMFLKMGGAR